jgi:hypothetical protein
VVVKQSCERGFLCSECGVAIVLVFLCLLVQQALFHYHKYVGAAKHLTPICTSVLDAWKQTQNMKGT